MKIHNLIYTLLVAMAVFLLASCSPEDFGFGKNTYSPEDLVEGKAYTVTIDGNIVKLESKIPDATPLWITPVGRKSQQALDVELPFAGDYEVTFGVETPGGIVYGEPYKFSLAQNDFTLLSDSKWFYLADKNYKKGDPLPDAETLSAGISKRWVPIAKDYGIGRVDCPLASITPYDIMNNGKGFTAEEEANVVYKDIYFGSENWVPNYKYGMGVLTDAEQSAYLDSWMEFSMDAQNGCVVKMYRGENGKKGNSTGSNIIGKYNLNLNDAKKPTITLTDAYIMHPNNWDDVCSNYATDIQIIELTPYLLQTVTKRTNSEGNWYIVESFVSQETFDQDGANIPKEDLDIIEATTPKLPTIEDLPTKMFTTDINGATFVGTSMTYLINDEAAYDWLWWNGGSSNWESVVKGNYGTNWAPMWGDLSDLEFVLDRTIADGKTTYKYTLGDQKGTFTISDNKLIFDKIISFFTVEGTRTIELKAKEWYVLKCDPGSELVLAIPETKDTDGKVNSYRVVNLIYKPVSSQTGPTVVPFTADNLKCYLDDKKTSLRCQLYNPWGGGGDAVDPARLKVKKNHKINVTVKLNGFTFEKPAKMVLCLNFEKAADHEWENTCFDYSRAITVNSDGSYTVSWTNDTGETCNWAGTSALIVTMQYVGYASLADDSEEGYKKALTVESVTIE